MVRRSVAWEEGLAEDMRNPDFAREFLMATMEEEVPLQVALLSPAGRPIAVTSDLARFWKNGWLEVRKDMRGRYPKHAWPEDPATAPTEPIRR